MSELRISNNVANISGFLSEKKLEVEPGKVRGENGDIPCNVIKGELAVENDNGTFTLRVYQPSKTKKGEDNRMYKALDTIKNTYVSKAEAAMDSSKEADLIDCSAKVDINVYPKADGTLSNPAVRLTLNSSNRFKGDKSSFVGKADIDLEGVIAKIVPEIKDEEQTGRLIVNFVSVAYGGLAMPYTLYVPADIADDFEDAYNVGDTCELCLEAKMVRHGSAPKQKVAFGRAANITSGYDVLELQVIGGRPAYEEDEVDDKGMIKCIDRNTLTELLNERKIYLDDMLKNHKAKGSDTAKPKKSGLIERTPLVEDDIADLF
jgi:hypothetical protein